jgi:hypothetical protein
MSDAGLAASAEPTPRQGRGRSAAVWAVLVVAGLLLLLSTFAIWIDRVALNTSVFADTSSSLLENDAIRGAVAARAVDELYANVDVEAAIEERLPSDVKSLSGPASAALRQGAYEIVDRALERPALQTLFAVSVEQAHRTLVDVLEGGGPRASTEGGQVTLDLRDIIREAAERIGIGEQVADRLPADAGRIVLLRSDQLDTAQDGFQLLKTLAWVLPLLTLAAFGFAVWLASDRRKAVRGVGIVLAVVGVVGLVAARLTQNYLVDSLVAHKDDRRAASNAWDILTDLMRGSFRVLIVVGVLFVVASWLAGSGRRALATRRWLALGLRERVWAYGALGIVALVLLLTGQVSDFARFLFVALVVALGATWIELMRRQTMHEFPDSDGPALVADARTRLGEWWDDRRPAPATPTAAPPVTDVTASLSALADLHARGELTDAEYASAKARVLGGD